MCEYYEINAKQYAEATFSADMSEQYQRFLLLLKEGATILDIGSGSGRDACYFQKMGYQVTALEPSTHLCKEIQKVFSGTIVCSDIQHYLPDQQFDGIWACASFLHLQGKEILDFLERSTGFYMIMESYIFLEKMVFLQEKQMMDAIFWSLQSS